MKNQLELRNSEFDAREVLKTVSESWVCLPYAFRGKNQPGFKTTKASGVAFLTGEESPVWRYLSYGRLQEVLTDSGAANNEYGDVVISRGGFERTVSPYVWSTISNASTMLQVHQRTEAGNTKFQKNLSTKELLTISSDYDPALYSEGEERDERNRVLWSTGNSGVEIKADKGGEVIERIKEEEAREFYRSQNLPAQFNNDPYYKRVGD